MSQHSYYQERIVLLETELAILKKQSSRMSWVRLALFSGFLVLLACYFFAGHHIPLLIGALPVIVIFGMMVNRNIRLEERIALLVNKLQVNREELLFLDHNYHHRDAGDAYISLNPHLATDFDLFGKGSLYQYINRCTTLSGRLRLANNICHPPKEESVIRQREEAIRELSGMNGFVENFLANGRSVPENGHEAKALQAWIDEPDENISAIRRIAVGLTALNIVWITLAAIGILTWASLLLPVFASLSLVGLKGGKIFRAHHQLENISKTFVKYTALFRLMETTAFESELLRSLQHQLKSNGTASASLKSLFRILSVFDIRDNTVLAILLNAFTLIDIHTFSCLLKWKASHKEEVQGWFAALAEMETVISLSVFAFNNHNETVYPTIITDTFRIEGEDAGHPLIQSGKRINNTFSIKGTPSVVIITGANMAGKSTFLRTVAVNLLLAMNGAPVVASRFAFTPCDILSSIKIEDSLSHNESYFYAELLRIKEIIDHVKQTPHTLVILDEILRGTNTKDKQTGSLGLLEKLIRLNAMVIIATHDLVIGELAYKYPDHVANRCFEVELQDERLYFDYKLKNGISKKLNASFLMKKMEIID